MRITKGDFIIGGHSKGGNLALYVYEHIKINLKSRIRSVYNFDGPSLNRELTSDKINVFVPQSSIFGIMLSQGDNFSIVKCKSAKFNQHDITSWLIEENDFVYAAKRSGISRYAERALNDFVGRLSLKERREFIDALFSVFKDTGKANFDELMKNPAAVVPSFFRQSKKKRSVLIKAFGTALKSAGIKLIKNKS